MRRKMVPFNLWMYSIGLSNGEEPIQGGCPHFIRRRSFEVVAKNRRLYGRAKQLNPKN